MLQSILNRIRNRPREEEEEQDRQWRRTYTPSGNTPAPPIGERSPVGAPSGYAATIRQMRQEADARANQPLVRLTGEQPAAPAAPAEGVGLGLDRVDTSTPSLTATQGLAQTQTLPQAQQTLPQPQQQQRQQQQAKRREEPQPLPSVAPQIQLPAASIPSPLPQVQGALEAARVAVPPAVDWLRERYPWLDRILPSALISEPEDRGPIVGALAGDWNPMTGEGIDQYVDTPLGAVLQRGYYNVQRYDEPENQILQKVAPKVLPLRQALDVTQAWGESWQVLGARNLDQPYTVQDGQVTLSEEAQEDIGTSAGEIWARGVATINILAQQRKARREQEEAAGMNFWQRLGELPNHWTNAWAASGQMLLDALTPTPEQAQAVTPEQLEQALAQGRSMAQHGIPAVSQQFDDMLELFIRQQEAEQEANALYAQAAALPLGDPNREVLEWQAYEKAGVARKLQNTHPVEVFDKNANPWMAFLPEMLFDPLNVVDGVFKLVGLAPKARRLARAAKLADVSEERAVAAIISGTGINKHWTDNLRESFNQMLGNWGQTNRSKAMEDSSVLWSAVQQMLPGFTAKEDIRLVLKTLFTQPQLLVQGIPIDQFKSPLIRLKDAGGVVKLPSAAVADWRVLKAIKGWFNDDVNVINGMIDGLPSLMGQGDANLAEVASDLYGMLLRGSANKYNVSKVGLVPAAANQARLVQDAQGIRVVYSKNGKDLYHQTYQSVAEAQKAVNGFNQFMRTGEEFQTNWLRVLGDLERAFTSTFTINNPLGLGSLVTNGVSNRFISIGDHTFGVSNLDDRIKRFVDVMGGLVPSENIARYTQMLPQTGGASTLVSREWSSFLEKIPGVRTVRRARNWDELRVKANVETKVWAEMVEEGARFKLAPQIEQMLQASGVTDPTELKRLTGTFVDAFRTGGVQKLRQTLNEFASGRVRLSIGALDPNYVDIIPDEMARQIDDILRQVNPENIGQMRQEVIRLKNELLAAIDQELADYGPSAPQRHWWTRLQMQEDIAEVQAELKHMQNLGLNVNVQEELQVFSQIQQRLNDNFRTLFELIAADPRAAPYITALWEKLQYLRDAARADIARVAEFAVTEPTLALQNDAWNLYWTGKRLRWGEYGREAQTYIDDVRQFLTQGDDWMRGAPTPRGIVPHGDARPLAAALDFDINEYFDAAKQLSGKGWASDPLKPVVQHFGQQGLDKFLGEMMLALQRNPTAEAFDHFLSAVEDVRRYYGRMISPKESRRQTLWNQVRALEEAGETVPQALWNEVGRAGKELTDAWTDYFEFAFSRYRAGSLFIIQEQGAVGKNIRFTPLHNWGHPAITGGQPVRILSFDIRDKAKLWVETANGKVHKMDLKFVPPDALDRFRKASAEGTRLLSEELGRLGIDLAKAGVADPDIQRIIDDVIAKGGFEDVYGQVLNNIQGFIANRRLSNGLPEAVEQTKRSHAGAIFDGILDGLNAAAEFNTKAPELKPLEFIQQFNRSVTPLAENILTGALRGAQEMQSFSTIDFAREYGADILSSIFSPYLFWSTRQGKNMLERMFFSPAWYGRAARLTNYIRSSNRADEGTPGRAMESVGTGLMLGQFTGNELDDESEIRLRSPIAKWMPFSWNFIFQGYGDYHRANEAYEYITEMMEEEGFKGFNVRGLADAGVLAAEVLGALGLPLHGWMRQGLLAASGRKDEAYLGALGVPFDLLGYTSLAMGGTGEIGGVQVSVPWAAYLAGRLARDDHARGDLSKQDYDIITAAIQVWMNGGELDPAFEENFPEAMGLAREYVRRAGQRSLISRLVGSMTGVGLVIVDEGERQANVQREQYRNMGYAGDGLPGGAARTQAYDTESPFYMPGVAAQPNLYDITELPQEEAERQDVKAVYQHVYRPQKEAIDDAFDQQMEALMQQFGGVNEENRFKMNEIVQGLYDQRNAARQQLDEAMPREAARGFEPSRMSGYNPEDARQYVARRLYFDALEDESVKAQDPGEYPGNDAAPEILDAWHTQNERHKQAHKAKWQEYLQDEERVREAFGDYPYIEEAVGLPPREGAAKGAEQPTGQPVPPAAPAVSPAASAAAAAPLPPPQTENPYGAPPDLWELMVKYGQRYGVEPGLIASVAYVETRGSYDPQARNETTGAQGMMQFLPSTWGDVSKATGLDDPYDPEQAIHGAAYYLNWIREQLPEDKKTDEWVLAAYHDGIGNAKKARSITDLSDNANLYLELSQPYLAGQRAQDGASGGMVWPVPGYEVGQRFGENPQTYKQFGFAGHEGIDIPAPAGTPVVAAMGGKVIHAGKAAPNNANYGNYVAVEHADGTIGWYAHLSAWDVKVGDEVTAGQQLGKVGRTGFATGNHLHFGIQDPRQRDNGYKGFVDPTSVVVQAAPVAAPAAAPASAPVAEEPTTAGNIQWGNIPSFEEMGESSRSPAEREYRQQRQAVLQGIEDRVRSTYPDYYDLWANEYRGASKEQKRALRDRVPEVLAASLLANNPEGWNYIEQTWGEGAALVYARIPASEYAGGRPGERDAYYMSNPQAFLIKAWLEGRPEVTEQEPDPDGSVYDNGADYEEAMRLFGADIWDVVAEAMRLPAYDPDNKETGRIWGQFHDANPQYSAWRDWWYGKLPDRAGTGTSSRYSRPWYSFSRGRGGRGEPRTWYNPNIYYRGGIQAPRLDLAPAPRFGTSGFDTPDTSGWRRWLSEGEALRNWRGR